MHLIETGRNPRLQFPPLSCFCHLQGLQHVIGLSMVHPTWQRTRPNVPGDEHAAWIFVPEDHPPLSSVAGRASSGLGMGRGGMRRGHQGEGISRESMNRYLSKECVRAKQCPLLLFLSSLLLFPLFLVGCDNP